MRSRRLSMALAAFLVLACLGFDLSSAQDGPTESVPVWEYTLPVGPINLVVDPIGDVWFCSFDANAIGKLTVATGQVFRYNRPTGAGGYVWGLKRDAAGNLWYTTVLTAQGVGKFEPSTSTFVEWAVPGNHFGPALDAVTGDVWFTDDNVPGVSRLSPSTNTVTAWSTSPHDGVFNLDVAPNGDVWFTVQPGDNQVLGRLVPSSDQVTVWTMPNAGSRPFRLIADGNDSIWLTEYGDPPNSIAHLTPSTNSLDEYSIPTANSKPWSLLKVGGKIWFTERGANGIGRLDPAQAMPTTTTLSPTSFAATKSSDVIAPASHSVTAAATPATVINGSATKTATGGFTEFTLPTADSAPAGMAFDSLQDRLWFAETATSRLGTMATGDSVHYSEFLFLPLVLKDS